MYKPDILLCPDYILPFWKLNLKKIVVLHDALFCETSPGPLKYAASLMGICSSEARLPIVDIEDSSKVNVKNALKKAALI